MAPARAQKKVQWEDAEYKPPSPRTPRSKAKSTEELENTTDASKTATNVHDADINVPCPSLSSYGWFLLLATSILYWAPLKVKPGNLLIYDPTPDELWTLNFFAVLIALAAAGLIALAVVRLDCLKVGGHSTPIWLLNGTLKWSGVLVSVMLCARALDIFLYCIISSRFPSALALLGTSMITTCFRALLNLFDFEKVIENCHKAKQFVAKGLDLK